MLRKSLALLILLILIPASVLSYDEALIVGRTPFAYQRFTATVAHSFRPAAAYRNQAGALFLTVENNNIRYRIDGGQPDINDGHLLVADAYQNLWLTDPDSIRNLRVIAIGGNAEVIITFYRSN